MSKHTLVLAAIIAGTFVSKQAQAATLCGDCIVEEGFIQQAESIGSAELPAFNQKVLDAIALFPTDGTHTYWWPRDGESNYDGVTEDVVFRGQVILRGEPQRRSFCCGLTLQVFFNAYQMHLEPLGGDEAATLIVADIPRFRRLWFVEEVMGPGPCVALEAFGLGKRISPEEARPGDFVQLWRNNRSGHSVVFIDWAINEAGERIGIRYWSTQDSTNGIGEATEYFIGAEGRETGMVPEAVYFARVTL